MTDSPTADKREILALHDDIVASALKLSRNEDEANQLTQLTFLKAFASPQRHGIDGELDTRLWLFSLLRSEFHSVARRRNSRRERGFTVVGGQIAAAEQTS